jgi:hypothetical protein
MKHLVFAVVFFYCLPLSAQTWSGTVSDIRTGTMLANARVCAGIKGRVDLTCGSSAANGTFSVTYPSPMSLGSDDLYYLYVERPLDTPYFHQVRARAMAGAATVQLVPTTAYIRGRVVSAVDGQPLAGIDVALTQPGRIDQTVTSDSLGEFTFKPVTAFTNSFGQFNTFGVPDEDLPPKNDGALVYAAWGVRAPYGAGSDRYATVQPTVTSDRRFVPTLPLVSSAVPESFTWVELRLPPVGTEIADVGPYLETQIGRPAPKLDAGAPDARLPTPTDASIAVSPDAPTSMRLDASIPLSADAPASIRLDASIPLSADAPASIRLDAGLPMQPDARLPVGDNPVDAGGTGKKSSSGCSVVGLAGNGRTRWGAMPFVLALLLWGALAPRRTTRNRH